MVSNAVKILCSNITFLYVGTNLPTNLCDNGFSRHSKFEPRGLNDGGS